jgi:ABC-type multidrug transport system permease subunit
MIGALLLLWPVAALVVTGITVIVGSKSLGKTFQEHGLPPKYVWLCLLVIVATGVGIFSAVAKWTPKEFVHPFFGPYALFIAYFSTHLVVAGVIRLLSVAFNSVALLVVSSSTLIGVVIPPIIFWLFVRGNETARSFLGLFWE